MATNADSEALNNLPEQPQPAPPVQPPVQPPQQLQTLAMVPTAVPLFLPPLPSIYDPDRLYLLLANDGCALHTFGRSDAKLNTEINSLCYALTALRKPLTKQMDDEMTEWNRLVDIAKATRRRVNLTGMDYNGILRGAIILKRYTLYLTTQISELMPLP